MKDTSILDSLLVVTRLLLGVSNILQFQAQAHVVENVVLPLQRTRKGPETLRRKVMLHWRRIGTVPQARLHVTHLISTKIYHRLRVQLIQTTASGEPPGGELPRGHLTFQSSTPPHRRTGTTLATSSISLSREKNVSNTNATWRSTITGVVVISTSTRRLEMKLNQYPTILDTI